MARLAGFDDQALKERFSFAYVGAIAYAAGVVIDEPTVDRDSVDVVFTARGQVGPRRSPLFHAQLKCHTGGPDESGDVVYDLPVKNYHDLIPTNHIVPRILIVVCVPDDIAAHAEWTPEQLLLRRCAYWVHLAGQPVTQNTSTTRVRLNKPFSPDALVSIFHDVANRRIV